MFQSLEVTKFQAPFHHEWPSSDTGDIKYVNVTLAAISETTTCIQQVVLSNKNQYTR